MPARPSRRTVGRVLAGLVCAGALLLLPAACGRLGLPGFLRGSDIAKDTPLPMPTPARLGVALEIRDEGSQDVVCAVLAARRVGAGPHHPPPAGETFVLVTLRLSNKSEDDDYTYGPRSFRVLLGSGGVRQVAVADDVLPNPLGSGTLHPAATLAGTLLFTVPANDHGARLNWVVEAAYGLDTDSSWLLGI